MGWNNGLSSNLSGSNLMAQGLWEKKEPKPEMMEASQWQSTKRRKGQHDAALAPLLAQHAASQQAAATEIQAAVQPSPAPCQARQHPETDVAAAAIAMPRCNKQQGQHHCDAEYSPRPLKIC